MAGVDESPVIEDVIETVEKVIENDADSNAALERTERLLRFPLTRIKTIIKTDNDVTIASLDAVVLIAKATVCSRALVECSNIGIINLLSASSCLMRQ